MILLLSACPDLDSFVTSWSRLCFRTCLRQPSECIALSIAFNRAVPDNSPVDSLSHHDSSNSALARKPRLIASDILSVSRLKPPLIDRLSGRNHLGLMLYNMRFIQFLNLPLYKSVFAARGICFFISTNQPLVFLSMAQTIVFALRAGRLQSYSLFIRLRRCTPKFPDQTSSITSIASIEATSHRSPHTFVAAEHAAATTATSDQHITVTKWTDAVTKTTHANHDRQHRATARLPKAGHFLANIPDLSPSVSKKLAYGPQHRSRDWYSS